MTNSTEAKKIKTPGPIRTGAVIPTLIFFAMAYAYFHFLFDSHLRQGIEWTSTYIHGAEVNVEGVKTSFFNGSFEIKGIQVTDKSQPTQNIFALGRFAFDFNWDALLRLKFVVDESAIENIEAYSPRKKAGWVRPPAPPSSEPTAIEKLEKGALDQAQKQFSGQLLGDIAQILGGTDEKEILKNIQNQLKAEKFIDDLKVAIKEKESFWRNKIENLPRKDEFEALNKRAKDLKFNTKDPSQFAKDLKELKKIVKEADQKIDEIKSAGSGLKTDSEKLKSEIEQIDDLIKKDIEDIEARLKIGKLNFADFSKDLFGSMIAQKVASFQKYAAVAKQYMPPPKDPSKAEEKIVPPARGEGENIRYPVKGGYPLFWLKKAMISSKSTASGFSGDLEGELTDVSTDPQIVARPTVFKLEGQFPKQEIFGLRVLATLDHREKVSKQNLDMKVGSYPISNLSLSSDSEAQLQVQKASGALLFNAYLEGDDFAIQNRNEFTKVKYDIQAKSKVLNEALTTILNGIPVIDLNASIAGTFSQFDMSVNSNLGRELGRGFEKYVKAKVDALKLKIRASIDDKIKAKRAELDEKYSKFKNEYDKILGDKKKELEAEKDKIEKSNSTSNKKEDAIKDDLKKKGKELLKKLKF